MEICSQKQKYMLLLKYINKNRMNRGTIYAKNT